jgi:anaerobic C4-dicarboxylate transporter
LLASVAQLAISNSVVSSAVAVVIFFLGQFVVTYTDILATVLLCDTKLEINIDAFRKKKREKDGEY